MVIYNTTYIVDEPVVEQFLSFVRSYYNEEALKSGILKNPRLSRILSDDDSQTVNFAYQFEVDKLEDIDAWYKETGMQINEKIVVTFGEKVLGFSTMMEVLDL